jgi:transketolase
MMLLDSLRLLFRPLKATRDAYGEALIQLGKENKDIVVLDADTSSSTRTKLFAEAFPERFFNVGIAEQNLIGIAAGLARCGKIPFASSFSAFVPGKCVDQIRNTVAYPRLNVKIVVTHSGITIGADGATHQAIEDIAIMRAIPNMMVVVPADAVETKKAIRAIVEYVGPVYVRLCRQSTPIIYDEDYAYTLGKGITLTDGSDAAVIACGVMVAEALKASEKLKKEGIFVKVIDMHTVKPIDEELIARVARETGAIMTAEDHNIMGGLGGAVAEILAENYPVLMRRVGVNDVFGESGETDELMVKYGLTADHIAQKVKDLIMRKG